MKKLYRSSLILAGLTFMFYSCDSSKEDETVLPTQEEINYIVIDANTTDKPIKSSMNWSDVDGYFEYIENHHVTPSPPKFTLDKKYFWARYSSQIRNLSQLSLHGSKMNGEAMCMNGPTGCDDLQPSTFWSLFGVLPQDRKFKWEYLNKDKSKGYRVEMTNIPVAANWMGSPARISFEEGVTFQFERNSEMDSIEVSLFFIPKTAINEVHQFPLIPNVRQWVFAVDPNETSFTMSKEALARNSEFFTPPAATDSVFLKLSTSRHVLKVIDNKEILITYRVNDLRPVVLEKKVD